MKQYRVLFGAYVRMYAERTIDAENEEAARKLAIEEFKARVQDIAWFDPQYDNLAFSSIVSMQDNETDEDVLDGYDFPLTPSDARQYAADRMFDALLNLMPEIEHQIDYHKMNGDDDWIELDRKAAEARAAIAEATEFDPQNSETRP